MPKAIVSYAQNREDIILGGFFNNKKDGFYVDVGANHPTIHSVTKRFYDMGWTGINIEPNRHLFDLLKLERPRDRNLNTGISDKPGSLILRAYTKADGLSTFSKEMQNDYVKSKDKITDEYKDYKVYVVTLKDIFEENKVKTINFMKIDVEGFEYEVIKSNDWNKYRPEVICIEANHILKDWTKLLQDFKYTRVFFDGLNDYYVANEHKEIISRFSYTNTILPTPIINSELEEEIKIVEWRLKQAEIKIIREGMIVESLKAEIHSLRQQIQLSKRIRSVAKQLAVSIDNMVSIQIEKLNKPKIKPHKPIHISDKTNPKKIIKEIQEYDFKLYYGTKDHKPILYILVKMVYDFIILIVRSLLRRIRNLLFRRRMNINV